MRSTRATGTNPRAIGRSPRQLGTNPRRCGTNTLAGTELGAAHAATQRARALLVLDALGWRWCERCSDHGWIITTEQPHYEFVRCSCQRMPVTIAEAINAHSSILAPGCCTFHERATCPHTLGYQRAVERARRAVVHLLP